MIYTLELIEEMTDQEIVQLVISDEKINEMRKIFRSQSANIEQKNNQSRLSGVEQRRMEFIAILKIMKVLGYDEI